MYVCAPCVFCVCFEKKHKTSTKVTPQQVDDDDDLLGALLLLMLCFILLCLVVFCVW